MAGISIIIANLLLFLLTILTVVGLIFLILSFIMKKKNNSKLKKIFSIIGLIFEIPLLLMILISNVHGYKYNKSKENEIKKMQNKIYVNENTWNKGFEFENKELVPISLLYNSANYSQYNNLKQVGTIVYKHSVSYNHLYEVKNNSNHTIYYVWEESGDPKQKYTRTFVEKDYYDEIINYYKNTDYIISILIKNIWQSVDYDDQNQIKRIIEIADNTLNNYDYKKESLDDIAGGETYNYNLYSTDKSLLIEMKIYKKNNKIFLYINDFRVDDEVVNKNIDLMNSLMELYNQK